MIGARPRRIAVALAAGLVVLTGCTAADRAVLAAPSCGEAAASTTSSAPASPPGTAYAWWPHPAALHVPGQEDRPPPQAGPVPGWTDVISIASSGLTTIAVRVDGTVWAYGLGHQGMLGDGELARHAVDAPQRVPGVAGARSVHVVGSAVFVVLGDGTVLGWGDDLLVHAGRRGSVGRDVATPTPVPGLDDVVTIAPGDLTALALRGDGSVAGWGINITDMLGDRSGTELTTISGIRGAVGVAAAGGAALAVTADGTVCAWGGNASGQLALEPRGGQSPRPVRVAGPTGVVQVAGGHDVAYALDGEGAVWAWGRGVRGALGNGDVSDHVSAVPTVVAGLPPARWIGAHGLTGYAIDADGGLWGWGSWAGSATPVRIPLPGPALAVSAGHAIVGGTGVAL